MAGFKADQRARTGQKRSYDFFAEELRSRLGFGLEILVLPIVHVITTDFVIRRIKIENSVMQTATSCFCWVIGRVENPERSYAQDFAADADGHIIGLQIRENGHDISAEKQ